MSKPAGLPLIELPVGPNPDWELGHSDDEEEKEEKQSIPDSCVILHSLRRSRERWLYSTFSRFSTKTRPGKGADPAPPPHTIQTRGKCDFEIGPHIFPDTVFYEVHYLPSNSTPASTPAYGYQPPNATGSSWQSTTPYSGSYSPYARAPVRTPQARARETYTSSTQATPSVPNSSTPLISSLDTVTTITPALINQVNAAASSNPTLANLLQLAAAGKASPEQLKTLGLLIQSLATPENTHVLPPALTEQTTQAHVPTFTPAHVPPTYIPPPIKDFDIVIEFSESSSERWVFPRGLATCERILDAPSVDATYHTIIKARLPFDVPTAPATSSGTSRGAASASDMPQDVLPYVVKFRLRKAPLAVWDTISRWVGGEEKIHQNRKLLEAMEFPERHYLAYRLEHGPLLSQLQTASLNSHLKPLKPGPQNPTRAKRKAVAQPKVDTTVPQNSEIEHPMTPQPTGPKRRRASKVSKKSVTTTPIVCFSCGQADVPLIFGGRFCRPCVDTGKVSPSYNYAPYMPSNMNISGQAFNSRPMSAPQETPAFIHSSLSMPSAPSNNTTHMNQSTSSLS